MARAITEESESRPVGSGLQVTPVDQVSSMLTSLAVLFGAAVAILFAIYLTSGETRIEIPLQFEEERAAGRGDHAAGFARDLEPPGAEDVQELLEPTLEQSLQAITSAVSSVSASFDAIDSSLAASSFGKGQGDSRPPGPLGEGDDIVPRYERWDLKFSVASEAAYASQLDYFKIELAAFGGRGRTAQMVDYASNLSSSPARRTGRSDEDKRLYFMWRQPGPLLQFDQQLLTKASVNTAGALVLKFIPKPLEDVLAGLEQKYAREKLKRDVRLKEIAKTIFEARPKDRNAYEWVVIDQRYRVAPK